MANERAPRKGVLKQSGTMFEYRVPKDYHAGMEERVAELVDKGYKVKAVTPKGTTLEIDKAKRNQWEQEKIAHFNATIMASASKDLVGKAKVSETEVGEVGGTIDDDSDSDVDG